MLKKYIGGRKLEGLTMALAEKNKIKIYAGLSNGMNRIGWNLRGRNASG